MDIDLDAFMDFDPTHVCHVCERTYELVSPNGLDPYNVVHPTICPDCGAPRRESGGAPRSDNAALVVYRLYGADAATPTGFDYSPLCFVAGSTRSAEESDLWIDAAASVDVEAKAEVRLGVSAKVLGADDEGLSAQAEPLAAMVRDARSGALLRRLEELRAQLRALHESEREHYLELQRRRSQRT